MQRISITNPQNIIDGTAKKYYFKLRNTGGPKGDKGEKGDTGATGPQGPQGDPCTVVVNSTATLEPGSNAYVTNTGSLSNAVLDFGIPKGDRGPQGAKGDKGDTGAQGETGPRGPQGERGTNATVSIGTTYTLNPGAQATVYNSGSDSNAVLNFGIPKGEKGDTGSRGPQGPTGPAGQNFAPTIVAELPATGDESKLYLTPKEHTTQTATGNPITASVTEQAGALESFQLDGDTFQQTYMGKNLLQLIESSRTISGVTLTLNSDGTFGLAGTATADIEFSRTVSLADSGIVGDQSYTISSDAPIGTYGISYYVHSVNSVGQWNKTLLGFRSAGTQTAATPSTDYIKFVVRVGNGTTVNYPSIKTMIEAGSTATDYEPYVGGQPSPNLDYPQPIQTVTGEQTVTINGTSYPINLGKNLFNKDSFTDADGYYIGGSGRYVAANNNHTAIIPIEPNTTYTVSKPAQATYNRLRVGISDALVSAGDYFPIWGGSDEATSVTLTSGSQSKYMYIYYAVTINVSDAIASLMLEKGSTATTYASYFTPIELCKLDTYQDYIYKDGESWKVHKAIGQIVFDSSTPWFKHPSTGANIFLLSGTGFIGYRYNIGQVAPAKMNTDRVAALGSGMDGSYGLAGITDDSQLRVFRGEYDSAYTARIFNEQMVGNYIYGALVTPTDTTITDQTLIAQLEAIRTASLENSTNTITNSAAGTNLAGDMEISYYGYNPTNRYDKFIWLDLNNNYEQIGS